jgi:hypothetical protein
MKTAATWVAFTLLAILVTGTALWAQRSTATYTVFGPGVLSCGRWVAEHEKKSNESLDQLIWVTGFVSGYEYASAVDMKADSDAMRLWVDNYCRSHPLENIANAAEALVRELRQK